MNKTGLVSISFRQHSPEFIVEKAKEAGLHFIEWGSDAHVPENDLENAKKVSEFTKKAGLEVSSYGTYYRLGQNMDIEPYLETARVLGTDILRIWAGNCGSAEVSADLRKSMVTEAKEVCKKASEYGKQIHFEYHRYTLTDTVESAMELIKEIDEPNCGLYWQPQYTRSFEENLKELALVLPYVEIVHMFYWDDKDNRLFLKQGIEEIKEYVKRARDKIFLLEFVPDNNIEYLKQEAESLKEVL